MADFPPMDSTPKYQWFTLGIVLIGLVVFGFYVIVWEPIHSRTAEVKAEVQQLGQEIQQYTTQNLHRPDWQARVKELELRVIGENQIFQKAIGQRGLRNRVTGIAKNHQLEITNWQPEPGGEESPDGIKGATIRVQIEGGYHQVATFFSRILHLPDVFGISQFTIDVVGGQTQPFHLQTNFVMKRVYSLSSGEFPKAGHHLSPQDSQSAGI